MMLLMNITDAQVRTQIKYEFERTLIILVIQWQQLGIRYVNKLFLHLYATHSIGLLDWNMCYEVPRARRGC